MKLEQREVIRVDIVLDTFRAWNKVAKGIATDCLLSLTSEVCNYSQVVKGINNDCLLYLTTRVWHDSQGDKVAQFTQLQNGYLASIRQCLEFVCYMLTAALEYPSGY